MKNIFSIRKQKGFNITDIEGHIFLDRKVDNELNDALDDKLEEAFELERKAGLKTYWSVIKYISLLLGIIIVSGIIRSDVSIETAYNNAPYLFYIGPIALILGLTIWIIERIHKKKVEQSEPYQALSETLEAHVQLSKTELNIPDDHKRLDVFQYSYKLTAKGKEKINTAPFFQFLLMELSFFTDEQYLYFADAYMVGKIEKTSFKSITPIKKVALVSGWNKDVWIDKPPYKAYKIRINQFDTLLMKPYYQLEIQDPLGAFTIFFPPYELAQFEALTGLKASL
ncbi:MAG: hypothetical protein RBQ70_01390 [Acholeplasma sp.]|jgi:hypothetical protein|nr:hypothetical protein [Acholeplasma sp.]